MIAFSFVLLKNSQSYLYQLQFLGSVTPVLVHSGLAEAVQTIHGDSSSSSLDGNCVSLKPVGTILEGLGCAFSAENLIES